MVQLSAAINAPFEVWEKAFTRWKDVPASNSAGSQRKFDSWPDFTWFTNLDHFFVRGTTISVSFWGSREISVAGYEGTVSISQLAEDALRFVFPPQPSNFLSLKERCAALQVIDHLRTAYKVSDHALHNRNVITRTFLAIREWLYDKLGRWDPGFKQIKTPARTSLRETLGRPEVEDRLLTLSKQVWEKSFPNTPLPAPVPEFNPQPLGPEPDQNLNHGITHMSWKLRRLSLEATPAYPATRAQITAAIRGESPSTVDGSAKSAGAKTRWKDAIREMKEDWIHFHQHRPIQIQDRIPPHWKNGDLVRLMQDGRIHYLKNVTQNDRVAIK